MTTKKSKRETLPRRRSRMWRAALASAACMGLATACVPATPSSEALESTIVLTKRAADADFGSYQTFFIRPEIRKLGSTGDDLIDSADADKLIKATSDHMIARGYKASSKETADLAIELVFVSSVNTATTCYSWWDYYYWGYPYYPYYGCTSSTWQSKTLVTTMVDQAAANALIPPDAGIAADGRVATKLLAGVWFGSTYGVVFDATSSSMPEALDGIDQEFEQSPYLVNLH